MDVARQPRRLIREGGGKQSNTSASQKAGVQGKPGGHQGVSRRARSQANGLAGGQAGTQAGKQSSQPAGKKAGTQASGRTQKPVDRTGTQTETVRDQQRNPGTHTGDTPSRTDHQPRQTEKNRHSDSERYTKRGEDRRKHSDRQTKPPTDSCPLNVCWPESGKRNRRIEKTNDCRARG